MAKTKDKAATAQPQRNTNATANKVIKTSAKAKATPKAAIEDTTAVSKKPSKTALPKLDKSIRCVCGNQEADPDGHLRFFVECMTCRHWQHTICMGLFHNDHVWELAEELPDEYHCDTCRPSDHSCLTRMKGIDHAKDWADIRLRTFAVDASNHEGVEAKKKWAVGEVLDLVRGMPSLYDFWLVSRLEVDNSFSAAARAEDAEVEREKLARAIDLVMKQATFAEVEEVRKALVLGMHHGPVTKTDNVFNAIRPLVTEERLRAIQAERSKREGDAEVRLFFGKQN